MVVGPPGVLLEQTFLRLTLTPQSEHGFDLMDNNGIPHQFYGHEFGYQQYNEGHYADMPRQIGSGAYGQVWSVVDPRTRRRVALKKLTNVFLNLMMSKRILREIRILSSLRHDNILSILDIAHPADPHSFNELHFITDLMETDLHRMIHNTREPITLAHAQVFIYQTLRGLRFLHSANIIHRDLKPANLLVNSNCLLKICDFGLAKVWDRNLRPEMTYEVVTLFYKAPELLLGCKRYTEAIDIWAVGCILVELLSRKIFFEPAAGKTQLIDQFMTVTGVLGTPSHDDLRSMGITEAVYRMLQQLPIISADHSKICALTPQLAAADALDFLLKCFTFNIDQRVSAAEAALHPFLASGQQYFHAFLCSCCHTSDADPDERLFCENLEPNADMPFAYADELRMSSMTMFDLRQTIFQLATTRPPSAGGVSLAMATQPLFDAAGRPLLPPLVACGSMNCEHMQQQLLQMSYPTPNPSR